MRYIAIDIETLGLDHENDILEFGAVADDFANPQPLEKLPKFRAYFYKPDDKYCGSIWAMAQHHEIFKKIRDRNTPEECKKVLKLGLKGENHGPIDIDNIIQLSNLPNYFGLWLKEIKWPTVAAPDKYGKPKYETLNVAGKNFGGFDLPFLNAKRLNWEWEGIKFPHRFLDPATHYVDPINDKEVPSLKVCMERAAISGDVDHTTIGDSLTVIRLLRAALL